MSQRLRDRRPRIIGWDRKDRPIWSIAGGSENDPGDSGAPEEGTEEGGTEESEESGAEEPDDDAGGDEKDTSKDRRSADAEKKAREQDEQTRRWRARISQADRRASEAEQTARRLKAELDKDKPESERLRGELAESEARVTRLQGINRDLALQTAFFRNSTVDWVDPGDAMFIAMRELSDLEVDEDGSTDDVEVKKVIDRLAKSKPHLVRRQQPKSGAGVGGKKGQDGQVGADVAALAQTFPALRTRMPTAPPRQ